MTKENTWLGKNVDLGLLATRIHGFFEADGFSEIRDERDPNGKLFEIQARKVGVARTLSSNRKALHVVIKGEPNNFEIQMGVGEWGKNIAALVGLSLVSFGLVGLVGLGLDVNFKNKLWKFIVTSVNELTNSNHGNTSTRVNTSDLANHDSNSKFCIGCGKKIVVESQFCPNCGVRQ